MKPFNLERALAGEPVVTRDGRPVKIAGYNKDATKTHALLGWDDVNDSMTWDLSGKFNPNVEAFSSLDLFMAPTERKEWIVRLNPKHIAYYKGPFNTKELAIVYADNWEGATIHEITIIE
jgi:hypothetical protein